MKTRHAYRAIDYEAITGLRAVGGPCEKLGPKILPDSPGDLSQVSVFTGTVIKNDAGIYHWYYTSRNLGGEEGLPRGFRVNVAMSEDGLDWYKPELRQFRVDGKGTCALAIRGLPRGADPCQPVVHRLDDGTWRLYFWLHGGEGVKYIRYLTAESEDGLNWECADVDRACVYHPADYAMPAFDWTKGLVLAETTKDGSPAAIEPLTAKRIRSNDATFVVRNPHEGNWEMYSVWLLPTPVDGSRRCDHDNAPGVLRTIHRRTSDDGLSWSDPELVLVPDKHDPMDQQFYHLGVNWRGRERIGFLGNYRLDEQTMDLEICFSTDGVNWDRPLRGGWIPRGGPGEPDSMSIYPADGIIEQGEHLLVPYGGGNAPHNAYSTDFDMRQYRNAGYLARFHRDRLVGLSTTGNVPGHLVTKPFIIHEGPLALDADILGCIRYSLCNAFGQPLEGYTTNDCEPISGDSHQHLLRWSDGKDADDFRFDAAVLRLELSRATLYAIRC